MTARRPRPPITTWAKLVAAYRDARRESRSTATFRAEMAFRNRTARRALASLLGEIAVKIGCEPSELCCDHEPALRVRDYNPRIKDVAARFTPNANDPDYLHWRPQGSTYEGSHHIKTNVRGEHGQYSDVVLIKRERRREERKRKPRPKKRRQAKSKWPSRSIPAKVDPWPKGRDTRNRRHDR